MINCYFYFLSNVSFVSILFSFCCNVNNIDDYEKNISLLMVFVTCSYKVHQTKFNSLSDFFLLILTFEKFEKFVWTLPTLFYFTFKEQKWYSLSIREFGYLFPFRENFVSHIKLFQKLVEAKRCLKISYIISEVLVLKSYYVHN